LLKKGHLLLLPFVVVFAGWFFLLRPGFLAGPAGYVLVSGASMEPTLHTGDLAVTRKQASYSVGDIVAFRVPKGQPAEGAMVIHRIVGGGAEEGFVMQGDNKDSRDPWHPRKDDIVGRLWFRVPGGASYLLRLRQPLILGLLAGGLGMLLVLDSGQKPKRPRQEKPPGQPSPGAPRDARRRFRPPPGLALWLLLGLLLTGVAAVSFSAR